jgi:hypothetical protein
MFLIENTFNLLFFFYFQQNMEFCCDSNLILIIQRNIDFYSDFYVHIIV